MTKKRKATEFGEAVADTGDGNLVAAAGVWNLHVRITNEDGAYFAQGHEIDYAAAGTSLKDVQLRFQCGLGATIKEHLLLHGTAKGLLFPAPLEEWQQLANAPGSSHTYSEVGVYTFKDPSITSALPYAGISYMSESADA